jgi:hypothetical protein
MRCITPICVLIGANCTSTDAIATTGWDEYRVQTGHYELAGTRNSGQVLIRDAAGRLLEPAALSISPVDNLTGPPQYMQQPDFLLLKYEYEPEDTQISQPPAVLPFATKIIRSPAR